MKVGDWIEFTSWETGERTKAQVASVRDMTDEETIAHGGGPLESEADAVLDILQQIADAREKR